MITARCKEREAGAADRGTTAGSKMEGVNESATRKGWRYRLATKGTGVLRLPSSWLCSIVLDCVIASASLLIFRGTAFCITLALNWFKLL